MGSTAPFVGLFGTVWGIMTAMHDISKNASASIDVVAGPIGEALIATGIGIAVAIPAVLGYNYFLRRLKSVIADYDDFVHDFLNLAQRAHFASSEHSCSRRCSYAGRPRDDAPGAIPASAGNVRVTRRRTRTTMGIVAQEDDAELSDINITPLVDVMLVLLVAFVITIPVLTNAVHVNLPKTVTTTPPDEQKAVTVTVDGDGKVFLNSTEVSRRISSTSSDALKNGNPDLSLHLRADERVPYGPVAKVMAAMEHAGISRVAILTNSE